MSLRRLNAEAEQADVALQAEILVERRRLKRRLVVWRLAAIVAVVAALALVFVGNERLAASAGFRPHVARVTISGVITDDREQQELLERIAKSGQVKAVILRINSPGGTTTGGEALYLAIRELAEKKPVTAVFGTVAASSAYLVGLASDYIVARGNSITGSVGVILQWAEVTKLLENIGVKMEEVRSGELKAVPSPFRPLDEEGRQLTREMVEEAEAWFRALVAERRSINPSTVPGLSEGRVYSGRQALRYKLIDAVGGEKEAVAWLEEKHQIPAKIEIIDWKEKEDGSSWLGAVTRTLAKMLGIPGKKLGLLLGEVERLGAVQLDGLVSLWHPSRN